MLLVAHGIVSIGLHSRWYFSHVTSPLIDLLWWRGHDSVTRNIAPWTYAKCIGSKRHMQMYNAVKYIGSKSLQEFNTFIIILKKQYIASLIQESTYLENELPRASSYVAATFHPTLGQLCSSISQHNYHPRCGNGFYKEKWNTRLTHGQIHTNAQPSQSTIWVYEDAKVVEMKNC